MDNIDQATEHNLVRARNQIALAKDMLVKMDENGDVMKMSWRRRISGLE